MSTKGRSLANLTLHGSLVPDADSAYDLGSSSKKWKSLHLSGNTLFLGDSGSISAGSGGVIELPSIEIGTGNTKVKLQASASGKLKTRKVVGGVDQDEEDVGGAAVTTYANFAAFPSSNNLSGAMGFATDTKAVYMWDDSSWQRMSIGNQLGPRYTTTPSADITLPQDGSTTTITGVALDDGGFPVTYDWDAFSGSTVYDSSNLPPQITASSRDSGVITLTPSSDEAHAGSFSFRFKASDGVLSTPAISNVILSFVTYVTVDTQQSQSSNTIQPTTNGTLSWYNTNSGGSTATLYLPYGGTNIAPLGKRYIEFKYISTTSSSYGRRAMIGVATRYYAEQYSSVVGYSGTATNVAYYYGYNGNKYPGGTAQGLTSIVIGDVVQLAYDTDAGKVWLGKNNTWSTLSGDPGAGGAGISVDATAGGVTGYSLILATGTGSSYTSVWEAGKQSASDTYVYSIPSGFSQF
jgi:hypothetical protein